MMNIEITVPDGECGPWRVESFEISEDEARFSRLRAHRDEPVSAGRFKRLMRGHVVVMSNTPMEVRTHREFIRRATGNVLINGLGLGMALKAILEKSNVQSVIAIEKSPDVIALVGPAFSDDARVKIINADAFEYQPERGVRFDAVWHDIWDYICADNLPEMTRLHRKYGRRTNWQGSWARHECELSARRWR